MPNADKENAMSSRAYLPTSWYDPRLTPGLSRVAGNGMFTTAAIRAGELVAVAGGVVMTEAEFEAYRASVTRWNAIQIGETLHLVDLVQAPEVSGASDGSINHSCDSNLWLADEVTIVARRDIAPGEEVTLDYALTTVEPGWTLDQPCQCGSPLCRHTISGNDWLLRDVQARYSAHFAPFINARISANGSGKSAHHHPLDGDGEN
jgi:uncharacterized protein